MRVFSFILFAHIFLFFQFEKCKPMLISLLYLLLEIFSYITGTLSVFYVMCFVLVKSIQWGPNLHFQQTTLTEPVTHRKAIFLHKYFAIESLRKLGFLQAGCVFFPNIIFLCVEVKGKMFSEFVFTYNMLTLKY